MKKLLFLTLLIFIFVAVVAQVQMSTPSNVSVYRITSVPLDSLALKSFSLKNAAGDTVGHITLTGDSTLVLSDSSGRHILSQLGVLNFAYPFLGNPLWTSQVDSVYYLTSSTIEPEFVSAGAGEGDLVIRFNLVEDYITDSEVTLSQKRLTFPSDSLNIYTIVGEGGEVYLEQVPFASLKTFLSDSGLATTQALIDTASDLRDAIGDGGPSTTDDLPEGATNKYDIPIIITGSGATQVTESPTGTFDIFSTSSGVVVVDDKTLADSSGTLILKNSGVKNSKIAPEAVTPSKIDQDSLFTSSELEGFASNDLFVKYGSGTGNSNLNHGSGNLTKKRQGYNIIKSFELYGIPDTLKLKIYRIDKNTASYGWKIWLKQLTAGTWSTFDAYVSSDSMETYTNGVTVIRYTQASRGYRLIAEIDYREITDEDYIQFQSGASTSPDFILSHKCYKNLEPINSEDIAYGGIIESNLDTAIVSKLANIPESNIYTGIGPTLQYVGADTLDVLLSSQRRDSRPYRQKYRTEIKTDKPIANLKNRYVAWGFADWLTGDREHILPLLVKYGYRNTFYQTPHMNAAYWDQDSVMSKIVTKSGSTIGNHGLLHAQTPYAHPMWNGFDQPPDSCFTDERFVGSGENWFGIDLTSTPGDIGVINNYLLPVADATTIKATQWQNLSSYQINVLRRSFSVVTRYRTTKYAQNGINGSWIFVADSLSNLFCGTSGHSVVGDDSTLVANWAAVGDTIDGGIFQGCSTTYNYEVWERLVKLENMFFNKYWEPNQNLKFWAYPGGPGTNNLHYEDSNGYDFYDPDTTLSANSFTKFTASLADSARSWYDVLERFGYMACLSGILDYGYSDGNSRNEMQEHFAYNSKYKKPNDLAMYQNNAFRLAGSGFVILDTVKLTSDDWVKQVYEYDESSNAFKDTIDGIVDLLAQGRVGWGVDDANTTPYSAKLWQLFLMFCQRADIDLITIEDAVDLTFNQEVVADNYWPNELLRNTIDDVLNSPSIAPKEPDGWTASDTSNFMLRTPSDLFGGNVNCLRIDDGDSVYTKNYAIKPGVFDFSYWLRGNGTVKLFKMQNKDIDESDYELVFEKTISDVSFLEHDTTIVIEDATYIVDWQDHLTDTGDDQTFADCRGYDNKVIGLFLSVKATSSDSVLFALPKLKQ